MLRYLSAKSPDSVVQIVSSFPSFGPLSVTGVRHAAPCHSHPPSPRHPLSCIVLARRCHFVYSLQFTFTALFLAHCPAPPTICPAPSRSSLQLRWLIVHRLSCKYVIVLVSAYWRCISVPDQSPRAYVFVHSPKDVSHGASTVYTTGHMIFTSHSSHSQADLPQLRPENAERIPHVCLMEVIAVWTGYEGDRCYAHASSCKGEANSALGVDARGQGVEAACDEQRNGEGEGETGSRLGASRTAPALLHPVSPTNELEAEIWRPEYLCSLVPETL